MVYIAPETDIKMNPIFQDKITKSLKNSRNSLRRIARNDDTESSPHSIMNEMEEFIKSVNIMDETLLVPCRLLDLKVGDSQDPFSEKNEKSIRSLQQTLHDANLFEIYNMLKNIKDGLLWGGPPQEVLRDVPGTTNTMVLAPPPSTKGHNRRPSNVSVGSTNSSASSLSDSDLESGSANENDSGIEEVTVEECATDRMITNFQRHLTGLSSSLKQMTAAAQYLTWRYQHNVDSAS